MTIKITLPFRSIKPIEVHFSTTSASFNVLDEPCNTEKKEGNMHMKDANVVLEALLG